MLKSNKLGQLTIVITGIVAIMHALTHYTSLQFSEPVLTTARWIALAAMFFIAYKRKNLTTWIFFAIFFGAELGLDAKEFSLNLDILSKIFLNLVKTIVAPLLFSTLVLGIAGHADMKQVGRMGWKSLLYFEILTTIALVVGLIAINLTRAGDGVDLAKADKSQVKSLYKEEWKEVDIPANGRYMVKTQTKEIVKQNWKDIILHTFPENIAKSIAEGQVLQVVIFSILFGIGLSMVGGEHKHTMLAFTESLAEVMFKFTTLVMYFAPFGVGGAMAFAVAKMGAGVFGPLIHLVFTLYAALIVFVLGVLLPVALIYKINIPKFLKAVAEPVSIAFGTASSEAALAPAMRALEKYGVPRKFVSFVLPTGMSFNLDGTTLYLSVAAVFVAQANHMTLTVGQQITILLTLMLTSKGVAGVARASIVILMGTVATFQDVMGPDTPIYIILAVDAIMDMARTSVNMLGNCLATVVIAKSEGEFAD
jgi:proton glutamate symport protein